MTNPILWMLHRNRSEQPSPEGRQIVWAALALLLAVQLPAAVLGWVLSPTLDNKIIVEGIGILVLLKLVGGSLSGGIDRTPLLVCALLIVANGVMGVVWGEVLHWNLVSESIPAPAIWVIGIFSSWGFIWAFTEDAKFVNHTNFVDPQGGLCLMDALWSTWALTMVPLWFPAHCTIRIVGWTFHAVRLLRQHHRAEA